jgi:hypothetical protein
VGVVVLVVISGVAFFGFGLVEAAVFNFLTNSLTDQPFGVKWWQVTIGGVLTAALSLMTDIKWLTNTKKTMPWCLAFAFGLPIIFCIISVPLSWFDATETIRCWFYTNRFNTMWFGIPFATVFLLVFGLSQDFVELIDKSLDPPEN